MRYARFWVLGALSFALLLALPAAGQEEGLREDPASSSREGSEARDQASDEYHTPLAGKRLEVEVFGRKVVVEERDRTKTLALTIGVTGFVPSIDDNTVVPFFALYYNGLWEEERHVRATISGLVNTVDYEEMFGGPTLLLHFDNYTLPFESAELVDGEELDASKLIWGSVNARVGVGYSQKVWPGNEDNAIKIGISYEGGLLYFDDTSGTPDSSIIPQDTYVHGLRLQGHLDMFQRNLMELPHYGIAAGFDLELKRRNVWRDFGNPGALLFDSEKTRDYLKLSGFLALAGPLPGLSERHRFLVQLHAGYSPADNLDRFSAFRVGGGPMPSESHDLARNPLPGAMFDQFPVQDFVIASVEYRLELAFWFYVHVRGHYALAKIPTMDHDRVLFRRKEDYMVSGAITSGFLWDSQLMIDVTQDLRGVLRGGTEGTSIMAMWSKAF